MEFVGVSASKRSASIQTIAAQTIIAGHHTIAAAQHEDGQTNLANDMMQHRGDDEQTGGEAPGNAFIAGTAVLDGPPVKDRTAVSLPDLSIGDVHVGFPVVQAALSGYSDLPMRVIARRHGASYTVCEVMLDQFLLSLTDRQRTRHFLDIHPDEPPVGGQLMGAEPEQFAAGAAKLAAAGFNVIDVNFGCPVKKVLGRCRGGFHLSQPETAVEVLRLTRQSVPEHIPVSLKMRRGIDDSVESRDKFFRILDAAIDLGYSAVTVHGRTVVQRYIGPSRWSFLKEVKSHVGDAIKLLGSGDLFTAADVMAMIDQTGVDGVTIARGAIGNPWIFDHCRALAAGRPLPDPPTLRQQSIVMNDHFDLCEQSYGVDRAPRLMRKFCIKYTANHPDHAEIRSLFTRIKTRDDFDNVVAEHYDDRPGVHVDPAVHRGQGE